MEVGLLLHTAPLIRDDHAQSDLRPVLDAAQQAEALGLDHVWLGDSSRMERGWPRADCIATLAALAANTRQIKLGVIPLSTPLRHPLLLAHQLATIDVLSHGRLLVSPSIGKGGPEGRREFANCGVPFAERGARLSEMLQVMKRLWTEPSVTFHGRFYQLDDATIFPKPINRPIPQYIATGRDERALTRAGRYGDGWITTVSDVTEFTTDLQKVQAAALKAGRPIGDLASTGLYATFHLDHDGEAARADAPEHIRAYFGAHRRGETNDFFGSPSEIGQRLQAFVDEGLTMLIVRFVEQDAPKQVELLREALSFTRSKTATSDS